jgi:hypothetical protein
MNRQFFSPGQLSLKAISIQLTTDPSGSLSVNGNQITGATTTSGTAVVSLLPPTATITSITTRTTSGPPATTKVGWVLKQSGTSAVLQINSFIITAFGGTGTPNGVVFQMTLPTNLVPLSTTMALKVGSFINNGLPVNGIFTIEPGGSPNIVYQVPPATALVAPFGLSLDDCYSFQAAST